MRFIDVWVNCPDQATAEKIAETCIAEKLAACANILPAINSVFRWKGAIEKAEEIPLLMKSRADLFPALAAQVRKLHPYEVPSILATDLAFIDTAYAEWLRKETGA